MADNPHESKQWSYRYEVVEQGTGIYKVHYRGSDAADAMAAWSRLIQEGKAYAMLEALRELPRSPGHG